MVSPHGGLVVDGVARGGVYTVEEGEMLDAV